MFRACRVCAKAAGWPVRQPSLPQLAETSSLIGLNRTVQHQQKRHHAATPVDLPDLTQVAPRPPKLTPTVQPAPVANNDYEEIPRNEVGVQLLPRRLHEQLFPATMDAVPPIEPQALSISRDHLTQNGLKASDAAVLPQTSFELPPLQGKDLGEHFWSIGREVAQPWLGMAHEFAAQKLIQPPEEHEVDESQEEDFRFDATDWLQLSTELRVPEHLKPVNWSEEPGWTKYPVLRSDDGEASALGPGVSVPYPDKEDDSLVFDVETLVQAGPFSVMATAVGRNAWYSWLSPWLLQRGQGHERKDHLIPLGPSDNSSPPRLVIGHNVSYDRARTMEEYTLDLGSTRWLDTMSLHVATRGISSPQRPAWMKHNKSKAEKQAEKRAQKLLKDQQLAQATLQAIESALAGHKFDRDQLEGLDLEALALDPADIMPPDEDSALPWAMDLPLSEEETGGLAAEPAARVSESKWLEETSKNSLADVARLHGIRLKVSKESRSAFVEASSREEILAKVQHLLSYCASDVEATHEIFCRTWVDFVTRCPHPATMAGVFGLGSTFLPVDDEWIEYREKCDEMFNRINSQVQERLAQLAEKLKVDGCRDVTWDEAAQIAEERAEMTDEENTEPVFPDPDRKRLWWEDDPWFSQLDWTPKKPRQPKTLPDGTSLSDLAVPQWYRENVVRNKTISGFSPKNTVAQQLLRLHLDGRPVLRSGSRGWILDEETFLTKSSLLSKASLKTYGDRLSSNAGDAGVAILDSFLGKKELSEDDILVLIRKIADAAQKLPAQEAENDVQLRQLDWTAKDLRPEELLELQGDAAMDASSQEQLEEQIAEPEWSPKWYNDLYKSAENGIHVTIRSSIAPLLLKISWHGCPLYRSREHGWVYRHDPTPDSTLVTRQSPLSFGLPADGLLQHLAAPVKAPPAGAKNHGPKPKAKPKVPLVVKAFGSSIFYKVPHSEGESANVGSPFAKSFIGYFEDGTLQSQHPDELGRAAAKSALDMNAQCSYWIAVRDRVHKQMVVWDGEAETKMAYPAGASGARTDKPGEANRRKGMILPQVVSMGTVTRRAIENTWLTASNAKKNRVGSELKAMVKAPPGYSLVGADVDSEELWICSVMGDAQFGVHGATAVGWMTLEGTKALGTDLHSKTASILGISRNQAKVFNYSRIYGAGIKHATHLLLKANPSVSNEQATQLAKDLYRATKGQNTHSDEMFERKFWFGGTESYVFNKLESIALSEHPQTPALDCGVTNALTKKYLGMVDFGDGRLSEEYMPSRINWVVQSSGVDYLHLLITGMDWLSKRYGINARFMLSVHDEVRYLVKDEDRHRAALALQIANIWTRSMFAFKLQMDDLPLGCAFFSQVDIDKVLRKEADDPCITPSHPEPIPAGIALTIDQILEHTGGALSTSGETSSTAPARTVTSEWCDPSFPAYVPSSQIHRSMGERGLYYLQAQASTELAEIRALEARATLAEGGTPKEPTASPSSNKKAKAKPLDEDAWISSCAEQASDDKPRRKIVKPRVGKTSSKRPTLTTKIEAAVSVGSKAFSTQAQPGPDSLSEFFPRKKAKIRTPFFREPSHRRKVLWQIYRPLLKECGKELPDWRAVIHSEMRRNKVRTSQADVSKLITQAEEVLDRFRVAKSGDEAAQKWVAQKEEEFATSRNETQWNRFWNQKLEEMLRPKRIPHHSGSLLPPTLYNRPLPRFKPVQPVMITMMIIRRRMARMKRAERYSEIREMMFAQRDEAWLMSQLDEKAEEESSGFEEELRAQIASIKASNQLDHARSQMTFEPKMLIQAKRARRSKARAQAARKYARNVARRQDQDL